MQLHVYSIAKACKHFGVEHVVICPGSRSAPLVFAFTKANEFKTYSMVDERSAAFMALGMAQQSQKPVVLICTSGTACLNFFPAVAEAFYQKIPLLILTADRPPELINQQDGQMIMQKDVFGKHVLQSLELPCYDEKNIDHQLTAQWVLKALKCSMSKEGNGPVHINVPLREPLYDIPDELLLPEMDLSGLENTNENKSIFSLPESIINSWKLSRKKIILIGQYHQDDKLSAVLEKLKKSFGAVILADVVSNQRGNSTASLFDSFLQFSEAENLKHFEPDFMISFGGPLVSKSLKLWLKNQKPECHIRVSSGNEKTDTYQNVTQHLQADISEVLSSLTDVIPDNFPQQKSYSENWINANQKTLEAIEDFHSKNIWCEPTVVKKVLEKLPGKCLLQLGNSSSVRWVSWNDFSENERLVYSNRGTSGIDGTLSTAIGSARISNDRINVLICGDLSLFYDQNGFWQKDLPANLKIIVLNNNGGNIFNWIAGPSQHPESISFFTTPNPLRVENLTRQYNLNYSYCENYNELSGVLNTFFAPSAMISVLEIKFFEESNLKGINLFKSIKL